MAPDKPPPPSEPEKQTQKAILKRIVDPAGPLVRYMQDRCVLHLRKSSPWIQPTMAGALQMLPPEAYPDVPSSSLTTRFVASTSSKTRGSIFCSCYAPDGRRMLTGDNSGGISVWNTLDFNYQQYLQAHNKAVRDICFAHNGNFLLSADDTGMVRVSTVNLKPEHDFKPHQLACRAVTVSPTDQKFASCSDDNVTPMQVWDLATGRSTALTGPNGHGSEVRCIDWHPSYALLASCGRDSLIKLWDSRLSPDTAMLATLQGHKQTVNKVTWNLNGTWLASCSRDLTVKVWDVRHTKREMTSWQGHGRDIPAVAWHPIHLDLLASAGGDGSCMMWMVGLPEALTKVEAAHDNAINSLAFHPLGHMMSTCGVDGVCKFWVRPRPGDPWKAPHEKDEDLTAKLAKATAGHGLDVPGLSVAAVAGAAAAAAAARAGAAAAVGLGAVAGLAAAAGPAAAAGAARPTTLPGGIAVQVPGQGRPGAGSSGAGVPGPGMFPGPPPPPVPGGPVVPGLGPGIPGLAVPQGMALQPGMGLLPGLLPGLAGPAAPAAAGAGPGRALAGRAAAAGRARGRGPMQSVMKRQRESYDGSFGFEAAPAAGHDGGWQGPAKQHQHHQQQHQQHHQQQHTHAPQQHHFQHQGAPQQQRPQFGRGFGGQGGHGRGFGVQDGGRGGRRGTFQQGRGEYGAGRGRGYARGRHR